MSIMAQSGEFFFLFFRDKKMLSFYRKFFFFNLFVRLIGGKKSVKDQWNLDFSLLKLSLCWKIWKVEFDLKVKKPLCGIYIVCVLLKIENCLFCCTFSLWNFFKVMLGLVQLMVFSSRFDSVLKITFFSMKYKNDFFFFKRHWDCS